MVAGSTRGKMGRPRGSSNPMNPTRLLKNGTGSNSNVMNLHLPPVVNAAMPPAVEEDLESQARSSISLFGFGSPEAVNWSRVTTSEAPGGTTAGNAAAHTLTLMERVCPIGTNAFLWSTMNSGESTLTPSSSALSDMLESDISAQNGSFVEDDTGFEVPTAPHLYGSKVLQQYLVKGVTVIPASLEEVLDLMIRSESDDMETTMQQFVGVKTLASGLIYRRRKKRLHQRHLPLGAGLTRPMRKTLSSSSSMNYYDSDSSSSSSGDEQEEEPRKRLPSTSRRPQMRRDTSSESEKSSSTQAATLEELQGLLVETCNRGNLSIKWAVGEKSGRMFSSRVQFCLVDYECIIVNDWEEGEICPMYTRILQSCYIPQCQPWLDEFGTRATDLQPAGFMVREVPNREGFVEVQFAASILEKSQLTNESRRAKLRALVSKISKLEETVTSRRLSVSLLTYQPLWVRNRERSVCNSCEIKFSLSRRRHHCRLCGDICCADCCPKVDVALPDVGVTSVRVCVLCVRKRRQTTDTSASQSGLTTFLTPSNPLLSAATPALTRVQSMSSDYFAGTRTLPSTISDRKVLHRVKSAQ